MTMQQRTELKADQSDDVSVATAFCIVGAVATGVTVVLTGGAAIAVGIGASALIGACAGFYGEGLLAGLKARRDPPDPSYADIRLPPEFPLAAVSVNCARVTGSANHTCNILAPAVKSLLSAVQTVLTLQSGLTIAFNGFDTAKAAGDAKDAAVQGAVSKTFSGLVAAWEDQQDKAGAALAADLRAAGVSVTVPSSSVAKVEQLLASATPPSAIATAEADLGAEGVASPALVRDVAKTALVGPAASVSLSSALTAAAPTSGSVASYDSMTLADLAGMVSTLKTQGVLSASQDTTLFGDLQSAENKCNAKTALTKFETYTKGLSSGYGALLNVAGNAVLGTTTTCNSTSTPPSGTVNLAGSWTNPQTPTAPPYVLKTADNLHTLTGTFAGGAGHSGLRGSLTATLQSNNTVYAGTVHITEGTLSVGGTITITIVGQNKLEVSLKQTNLPNTQVFELDRG